MRRASLSRLPKAVLLATASTLLCVPAAVLSSTPASAATSYQWGLNSYVADDCSTGATWLADAQHQMAGFKSLGANSVAIAFPIYTGAALSSNDIHTGLQCGGKEHTPSAARIGVVIAAAHADRLKVMLRPLIDEASLGGTRGAWRGLLRPSNPKLWFAHYQNALTSYLRIAQTDHVERFAIASELDALAHNTMWKTVITQAHRLYKGGLSFAANWSNDNGEVKWPGTSADLDTYVGVAAPPSATPIQLLGGWNYALKARPLPYPISQTTIDEVGIVAQDGAYPTPWAFGLPVAGHPFDPTIQANWFKMVCSFVKQHAIKGAFFWGSFLTVNNGYLLSSPNASYPQAIQPLAQSALKTCFA